jgi:hypothetical protein
VPADHQDDAVQEDERVDEPGQREAITREPEYGGGNERREDIQDPDDLVERPVDRPEQYCQVDGDPQRASG